MPMENFMKIGPHLVSSLWKHLLPEEFSDFHFPEEKKATCLNCPKIKESGFHVDIRCCTYQPRVPNFLVGYTLKDAKTAHLFEKLIAQNMLTPEGLQQTPFQAKQALELYDKDEFGKTDKVCCPFLDRKTKLCQVYAYRNSVCSTFFCKHDDGESGETFWENLQSLVMQIETALSQWCMAQLGFDMDSYINSFNALSKNLDELHQDVAWTESCLRSLWGDWYAKQKDFFIACAELIDDHKSELFSLAEGVKIKQPLVYDHALYDSLPQNLKRIQGKEAPPGGEPYDVGDLWYMLKLSQHKLTNPD